MSWYRTGTVAVTNGSKTVTGVGTLFTTAVNAGDAFALVDANLNPTGAWYEVDVVVSNTEITLKQSYAGTTGSNNQYCVFNMVGNMTTPSFAQRLATFFASFQSLIDKPTTTPTALGIPVADANGDIDSGWIKDTSTTVKGVVKVGSNISVAEGVVSVPGATETVKGVVELATSTEVLAGVDTERVVTSATAPRVYNQRLVIKSSSLFDGILDLSSGIISDSATAGEGTAQATVDNGNFTPGVTGWYKVTIIGGGGGGGHKPSDGTAGYVYSGAAGGGASGCIKTVHLKLVAGTDYAYAIGGAGSGGTPVGDIQATGGGTTTFNGISALGGGLGISNLGGGIGGASSGIGSFSGGVGGLQTSNQAGGDSKYWTGGAGGGMGGGQGSNDAGASAVYYGGGGGGAGSWNSASGVAGGIGFQGCVILEFYDPSV